MGEQPFLRTCHIGALKRDKAAILDTPPRFKIRACSKRFSLTGFLKVAEGALACKDHADLMCVAGFDQF